MFECRAQFIHGLLAARRPVGLCRRGRALLCHSVERAGNITVIRGHWTPLTYPRITDVIRRLRVGVVAPESFVKVSGLDLEAL